MSCWWKTARNRDWLAGDRQRLNWTKLLAWAEWMAQNFWTLALLLDLMKTGLDFFHSRMDRDETPGRWGQCFISIAINLTTTPHLPVRGSLEMLFLWLCGRTSFPLATVRWAKMIRRKNHGLRMGGGASYDYKARVWGFLWLQVLSRALIIISYTCSFPSNYGSSPSYNHRELRLLPLHISLLFFTVPTLQFWIYNPSFYISLINLNSLVIQYFQHFQLTIYESTSLF